MGAANFYNGAKIMRWDFYCYFQFVNNHIQTTTLHVFLSFLKTS